MGQEKGKREREKESSVCAGAGKRDGTVKIAGV